VIQGNRRRDMGPCLHSVPFDLYFAEPQSRRPDYSEKCGPPITRLPCGWVGLLPLPLEPSEYASDRW